MARLSDAFFVPSLDDIEFIKAALRKAGIAEEDVNSKKWQCYKTRVRRTVPGPVELEREFKRVVQVFADLLDAKTGKPLFSKDTWNLHKSTLKHTQKGCLSDVAGMLYYVQLRTDSMGIPMFKCLRGTNALEGFHQKIRQVIRGFNVSPRHAVALLHEFVCRWNHDVDVRVMGLPKKHSNCHDGWVIEEEIEEILSWEELESPVHPHWETTRDCADTGEVFGVVEQVHQTEAETDKNLEAKVAHLVDHLNDGMLEEEDETEDCNVAISNQVLVESAAWAGTTLCRSREIGPVTANSEIRFFADNHIQHMKTASDTEADNCSSFAWDRFSLFWNGTIAKEEARRRPKSNMRLKSAFHLQACRKKHRKEANARATLLDVQVADKNMRHEHRGLRRDMAVANPAALAIGNVSRHLEESEEAQPRLAPPASVDAPVPHRVQVPLFPTRHERSCEVPLGEEAGPPKKKNEPRRCRSCGHSYEKGSDFEKHHQGCGKVGSRGHQDASKRCTTPTACAWKVFLLRKDNK
jgi:hypothetical protein